MTTGHKVGDWPLALQITTNMEPAFQKAVKKAVLAEAHFLRTKMVRGIRQGAPAGKRFLPLAASTLAIRRFKGRGGNKPLIVTGALRNAIRVKKLSDGKVFVGVLRSANAKAADVADIQENGSRPIVIPLTPKARAFLMKVFRESNLIRNPSSGSAGSTGKPGQTGGTTIAIVRIPPRPFIKPVVDRFAKPRMVKNRLEGNLARELGGMLGKPT